ncbi:response regulator [Azonexus sp. IMCC34839]|uniref:response regulator n=1 Tax=Azonexus sp. IMCC34839 TaxID=3133695 RepID=UPI00399BD981
MADHLALVVDDNATNRLLAATILKKLGWSVSEVDCGERALEEVALKRFRFVLLDISMPGLTGEETCVRLRAAPDGEQMFIVAYTAHAFPEERDRILAAGFDDLLIKPFSRQQLEALVEKL